MKEFEVETIIQRAREQFPGERPRIISDNGPQFVAKDFKEFIRICGMTHVRTSFYYPQSNGKMERWYKTLKTGCIRVTTLLSLEDARRLVAEFVAYYNMVRLHSAIAYITQAEKLAGRAEAIWAARRQKPNRHAESFSQFFQDIVMVEHEAHPVTVPINAADARAEGHAKSSRRLNNTLAITVRFR